LIFSLHGLLLGKLEKDDSMWISLPVLFFISRLGLLQRSLAPETLLRTGGGQFLAVSTIIPNWYHKFFFILMGF
jgi:hypothetical protein